MRRRPLAARPVSASPISVCAMPNSRLTGTNKIRNVAGPRYQPCPSQQDSPQWGEFPSSNAAGTSLPPAGLAEHRVLFGVGHEFPDLLRAAAGGSGLGSPLQRLRA